jgi:hypothetical protein
VHDGWERWDPFVDTHLAAQDFNARREGLVGRRDASRQATRDNARYRGEDLIREMEMCGIELTRTITCSSGGAASAASSFPFAAPPMAPAWKLLWSSGNHQMFCCCVRSTDSAGCVRTLSIVRCDVMRCDRAGEGAMETVATLRFRNAQGAVNDLYGVKPDEGYFGMVADSQRGCATAFTRVSRPIDVLKCNYAFVPCPFVPL